MQSLPVAPSPPLPPETGPAAARHTPAAWQRELAAAIRDPIELCALLELDAGSAATARAATGGFPLLVPRGFAARMRPRDPRDPLLLQVLPTTAEQIPAAGFFSWPPAAAR